jgi:predicted kinase
VLRRALNTRGESSGGTKTKARLLIFCGIPGSGKTTIARIVAAALGRAVHVQTDALRLMIPAPKYTWAEARFVYESAFLVGRHALKSGYDVILDGTFLREDYRAEAVERLARYCSSADVVCVICDQEVARARNSERETTVPEASFDRLVASFERPRRALFVHTDGGTPQEAADYLLRGLGIAGRSGASRPGSGPR